MTKRKTKIKKRIKINNKNINKNIINIKINPIQQTNRRRRRRKQLNKSLNKKPVDKVQGYHAKPNTNMKQGSYYNSFNSFQRTKDLLLQDDRTKHLLDYKPLQSRDDLMTKNLLLENNKEDTKTKALTKIQTKPLITEIQTKRKPIKNEPEHDDEEYKNNDANVHKQDDEQKGEEEKDDLDELLDDLRLNYYSKTDVRTLLSGLYIKELKQLYYKQDGKTTDMKKKILLQWFVDRYGNEQKRGPRPRQSK